MTATKELSLLYPFLFLAVLSLFSVAVFIQATSRKVNNITVIEKKDLLRTRESNGDRHHIKEQGLTSLFGTEATCISTRKWFIPPLISGFQEFSYEICFAGFVFLSIVVLINSIRRYRNYNVLIPLGLGCVVSASLIVLGYFGADTTAGDSYTIHLILCRVAFLVAGAYCASVYAFETPNKKTTLARFRRSFIILFLIEVVLGTVSNVASFKSLDPLFEHAAFVTLILFLATTLVD